MRTLLLAASATLLVSCGAAAPPSGNELEAALHSGAMKFEIRGLKNVGTEGFGNSTTYMHTASVLAIGDTMLAKQPMFLIYTTKRLSGGDPKYDRSQAEFGMLAMQGGVGELSVGGGYKLSTESWAPEKIEVSIIGVVPMVSFKGPTVSESP